MDRWSRWNLEAKGGMFPVAVANPSTKLSLLLVRQLPMLPLSWLMEQSMSEESPSRRLGAKRQLRKLEKALLEQLLRQARQETTTPFPLDAVEVCEMADGSMGSLYFAHPYKDVAMRYFGKRIAELQFADSDGVAVLVSLNVDTDGELFELDIWKTDFTPLISLRENT